MSKVAASSRHTRMVTVGLPSGSLSSDSTGLYGGAAIKGGILSTDTEANIAYYGESLTPKQILFDRKGTPSEAATVLMQKITQASK